jgi:hypothetical protein
LAHWTDPNSLLTAGLVIIAAVQVGVYLQILASSHRVDRAYIFIDAIVGLEGFGDGRDPTFTFRIKNLGKTPGQVVAYNAMYVPGPLPVKMPLKDSDLRRVDLSIASNQEHTFAIGMRAAITYDDLLRAIDGQRPFVIARVLYRDRFQLPFTTSRYSNFCATISLRRDRVPGEPPDATVFGFDLNTDSFNDAS